MSTAYASAWNALDGVSVTASDPDRALAWNQLGTETGVAPFSSAATRSSASGGAGGYVETRENEGTSHTASPPAASRARIRRRSASWRCSVTGADPVRTISGAERYGVGPGGFRSAPSDEDGSFGGSCGGFRALANHVPGAPFITSARARSPR